MISNPIISPSKIQNSQTNKLRSKAPVVQPVVTSTVAAGRSTDLLAGRRINMPTERDDADTAFSPYVQKRSTLINFLANLRENNEFKSIADMNQLLLDSMRIDSKGKLTLLKRFDDGTKSRTSLHLPAFDEIREIEEDARNFGIAVIPGKYDVSLKSILRFYGIGSSNIATGEHVNQAIKNIDKKISEYRERIASNDPHNRLGFESVYAGNPAEPFPLRRDGLSAMVKELEEIRSELAKVVVDAKVTLPAPPGPSGPRSNPKSTKTILTNGGKNKDATVKVDKLHIAPNTSNANDGGSAIGDAGTGLVATAVTIPAVVVGGAMLTGKTLPVSVSSAAASLASAAAVAGGTLLAVVAPGVAPTVIAATATYGEAGNLYSNLAELASRLNPPLAREALNNARYVKIGGCTLLVSSAASQTGFSFGAFLKNPSVRRSLETLSSGMATIGVAASCFPEAGARILFGRMGDLAENSTKGIEAAGAGLAFFGVNSNIMVAYYPEDRGSISEVRGLRDMLRDGLARYPNNLKRFWVEYKGTYANWLKKRLELDVKAAHSNRELSPDAYSMIDQALSGNNSQKVEFYRPSFWTSPAPWPFRGSRYPSTDMIYMKSNGKSVLYIPGSRPSFIENFSAGIEYDKLIKQNGMARKFESHFFAGDRPGVGRIINDYLSGKRANSLFYLAEKDSHDKIQVDSGDIFMALADDTRSWSHSKEDLEQILHRE